MPAPTDDRPNILLVITDQERQRAWLPADAALPARRWLLDHGIEFTNYYANSVPCSPSRACLQTGRYVSQHGVKDNVIRPTHQALSPEIPTLGSVLRASGYRTAYVGKWHLSHERVPPMEEFGYGGWSGDDLVWMGLSSSGLEYDPVIADQAVAWLRSNGGSQPQPWFLTVALVNPHDVMWFPIDQPDYQQEHAAAVDRIKDRLRHLTWRDGDPIPPLEATVERRFDALPANFDDDLFTKPAVHRHWYMEQNGSFQGTVARDDEITWLRMLDYYLWLHEQNDRELGRVLDAAGLTGAPPGERTTSAGGPPERDTVVIFTSDHGEMCGSHGLRSKGPFVYEENLKVPLYVVAPGLTTAGAATPAMASHVDLASTILALGGASDRPEAESFRGVDLTPVLRDPGAVARKSVLFEIDQAEFESTAHVRYAVRGYADGAVKYARYYGIGGGTPLETGVPPSGGKRFDVDAAFEDQDHEWYDLVEDPFELENLANDRGRRKELRELFMHLREQEAELLPWR